MGYIDRERAHERARLGPEGQRTFGDKQSRLQAERVRVSHLLSRADYPGWQFAVDRDSSPAALIAFRAGPGTGELQRVGPWPLPEDPGFEEVRAAALALVVEHEGEGARARFAWRDR